MFVWLKGFDVKFSLAYFVVEENLLGGELRIGGCEGTRIV